jgi:hypothetical protein
MCVCVCVCVCVCLYSIDETFFDDLPSFMSDADSVNVRLTYLFDNLEYSKLFHIHFFSWCLFALLLWFFLGLVIIVLSFC